MDIPWTFHGDDAMNAMNVWKQVETNKTSADHKVGFPILSDGSVMVRSPSLALTDLQKWHLLGGDGNHGMSHNFPIILGMENYPNWRTRVKNHQPDN